MLTLSRPFLPVALTLTLGVLAAAPAAHGASSATETVHTIAPSAQNPDLAINEAGDAIVAYVVGSGSGEAFVRRLSAQGTLGAAVKVSADGEEAFGPEVVLLADGRAFVVWRSGAFATNRSARGRFVEVDGTLGPVITVAAAPNTGQATDRDVIELEAVRGSDGDITVSWENQDFNSSSSGELEMRRVTPAGGLQPAGGPLSNISLDSGVTDPVVAALPGGATVFAWRSGEIRAVVVGANEAMPASTTAVSAAGLVADPSIAVDAAGTATLAWRRSTATQYAVSARRIDATGATSGAVFDPSPAADGFVRIATPVTVNAGGDALFGWGRQAPNDARLTVRSRTSGGTLGAAEIPLSNPADNLDTYDLTQDGLGNAYAAWTNQNTDPARAVLQPLTFTGTRIGGEQPLDTGTATTVADMAFGGQGIGAVLLQRYDGVQPVLVRQLIPPPGGCTDAAAATTAPAPVEIPVGCQGVQARARVLAQPSGGSVADGPGSSVIYTPNPGFSGTDTFTVRAVNAAGVTGGTATVTVTVAAAPATPAGTTADTIAPVISRFSLSRNRFAAGGRGAQASAKRRATPIGTTLRFTLSERARVTVTLRRALGGRVRGGRCVAPSKRTAKAKRCTRLAATGSLARDLPAGKASVVFSGKRRGRALAAGRYRITLTARDAAGNTSRPVNAWATIVRRR